MKMKYKRILSSVLSFLLILSLSFEASEVKAIDKGIIDHHNAVYEVMTEEFQAEDWTLEEPYIVPDPYESSPLSAMLGIKTEELSKLSITISGLNGDPDYTHEFTEFSTEFLVPVLGLYPDHNNEITLTLTDETGVETSSTIYIQTNPLPTDFGTYTVTNPVDPSQAHDELYFSSSFTGYINGIDCFGNVRWYIDQQDSDYDPLFTTENFSYNIVLDNGHYLAEDSQHRALIELDELGRIYEITEVDFDIHHEFLELDDGNYLVQSQVDDAETIEDMLTVIEKGTGEKLSVYYYKDILDVNRPAQPYSTNDWLHANSLDIDSIHNSLITSSRHQNAVFSIDNETQQLEWILGSHQNWSDDYSQYLLTPVDEDGAPLYDLSNPADIIRADLEFWNWGQHSAKVMPTTTEDIVDVIIFNNNTYGTFSEENWIFPYDNHSEPREYRINLDDMTVQKIWSANDEGTQEFYSGFVGSVRYHDNKILTNYGATNEALNFGMNVGNVDDVPMDNFTSDMYFTEPILTTARIVEYDYDTKEEYFSFTYTDENKIGLYNNGIFAVDRHGLYL